MLCASSYGQNHFGIEFWSQCLVFVRKINFFRKCVLMALILSLENLLHIPVINSSGDALCVELWPKPFLNRILAPMFGIRFFSFLKPAPLRKKALLLTQSLFLFESFLRVFGAFCIFQTLEAICLRHPSPTKHPPRHTFIIQKPQSLDQ